MDNIISNSINLQCTPNPVVSSALWCLGYSIAVVGAHFRQNRRNVMLFTFLALNTGYGAINWM